MPPAWECRMIGGPQKGKGKDIQRTVHKRENAHPGQGKRRKFNHKCKFPWADVSLAFRPCGLGHPAPLATPISLYLGHPLLLFRPLTQGYKIEVSSPIFFDSNSAFEKCEGIGDNTKIQTSTTQKVLLTQLPP